MRRAVLALLLAGCSYDWAVSDASPGDAAHDTLPVDAPISDAPIDAIAEPPIDASPTDSTTGSDADGTSPPDAAECQQLLQTAKNALGAALVCTPSPSACKAQTQDWCGCTVYLADGTSPEYTNFVSAVTAFEMAGCRSTIFCGDTCPSATPGLCILSDAGAAMYACYQ